MIFKGGAMPGKRVGNKKTRQPDREARNRHAETSPVAAKRVLIADEDPALVRQLTEAINRNGFSTLSVCDGREALQILHRDSDFVAAIFAVAMSHIQGPDLVR